MQTVVPLIQRISPTDPHRPYMLIRTLTEYYNDANERHGDLYELHVIRRQAILILKHLKYVHALKRRGQLDLVGRSVIDSRLQLLQGRASVQQGLKALRKIQQRP